MYYKLLFPVLLVLISISVFVNNELKHIASSIAIFIFGLTLLESGVKKLSSNLLSKLIEVSSKTHTVAVASGLFSTILLQSSTLIILLTSSFTTSGLLNISSALLIVIGSNLGTTTSAWIISLVGFKFNISTFALPLLSLAVFFNLHSDKKLKSIAKILAGLGLLFLGIDFIKDSFVLLKQTTDIASYNMTGFTGALIFFLSGLLIASILMSSNATLIIVMTALVTQQISFENAAAATIGAGIGSTLSIVFLSISSKSSSTKQIAFFHLFFNLSIAIIFILFFNQFINLSHFLAKFLGIRHFAGSDLAIYYTGMKLVGLIIFFPFINQISILLSKTFKVPSKLDLFIPAHLNPDFISIPSLSLHAIYLESRHLFYDVFEIITSGIDLLSSDINSDKPIKELVGKSNDIHINVSAIYTSKINPALTHIIKYATNAHAHMDIQQKDESLKLIEATRLMAVITKDIKRLQKPLAFSFTETNENYKKQYFLIRRSIAKTLRRLKALDNDTQGESMDNFDTVIDKISEHSQSYHQRIFRNLSEFIVNSDIDPEKITPLYNDNAIALDITYNLIQISHILHSFSNSPHNLK